MRLLRIFLLLNHHYLFFPCLSKSNWSIRGIIGLGELTCTGGVYAADLIRARLLITPFSVSLGGIRSDLGDVFG